MASRSRLAQRAASAALYGVPIVPERLRKYVGGRGPGPEYGVPAWLLPPPPGKGRALGAFNYPKAVPANAGGFPGLQYNSSDPPQGDFLGGSRRRLRYRARDLSLALARARAQTTVPVPAPVPAPHPAQSLPHLRPPLPAAPAPIVPQPLATHDPLPGLPRAHADLLPPPAHVVQPPAPLPAPAPPAAPQPPAPAPAPAPVPAPVPAPQAATVPAQVWVPEPYRVPVLPPEPPSAAPEQGSGIPNWVWLVLAAGAAYVALG